MAAQTALTVAGMFDYIRRRMRKVPGPDMFYALPSGFPSPPNPDPDNQSILDALNDAIDWLNSKVRCGAVSWTAAVSVSAAPSTVRGAYPVDISGDDSNTLLTREVTDVVFSWNTSINGVTTPNYSRLRSINYGAMLSGDTSFQQEASTNVPDRYLITGTTLCLVPPPAQSGNLYLLQTEGIPQLVALTDTIVGPPVNLHSVIYYMALAILFANDVDASQSAANRSQAFEQMAVNRLADVVAWKQGFDPTSMDILRDLSRMVAFGEQQRRGMKGQQGVGT